MRKTIDSTLKRVAGNVYCTKEHDSLKISNGKWYWWSRGFGGVSALDYLIKVKQELSCMSLTWVSSAKRTLFPDMKKQFSLGAKTALLKRYFGV